MTDEAIFLRVALSIPAAAVILGGSITAIVVASPGLDIAHVLARFQWIAAPACLMVGVVSNHVAQRLLQPRSKAMSPVAQRLQI